MSTISELMEGKERGSVKVCLPHWGHDSYFSPWFQEPNGYWHGQFNNGIAMCYPDHDDDWQLWQEPKKEVVRYKWAIKNADHMMWVEEPGFYASEEEIREAYNSPFSERLFKRLDYTATTFPE